MNKLMRRTTIGSVMRGMCYGFAALLFAAGCANDDVAQDEKQKKDNIPAGTTVFTGTSLPDATTRTAILNHTKGAGASVNWSSTDKIWVKDDGGNWQQSTTTTIPSSVNPSFAKFALTGTYTGATHDVLYTNVPISGTQPQVEIKKDQTQSAPNNFDHAGVSGDFGIATGNKDGNVYNFTLNHKASYLCFIPRTNNEYVKHSKLFKVEIMSDDDIAGTYNIAADGTLTLASGGSKTITVTTGSGFDIDNSTADMNKNATYAVVAPGTHSFRIRYWLRNTTDNPDGTIEGTVSKIVTLNCTAGSIHDITANLDPHDYDGTKYYMWDAQQQYWYGYEWTHKNPVWQPTLSYNSPGATTSSLYPKSNTDSRWYHEGGGSFEATQSCAVLPNANEMAWYCMKGDPRRDEEELWTTMGHLYKGGIWFKKKTKISGFTNAHIPDNTTVDLRTVEQSFQNNTLTPDLPAANKMNNYFYLPDLGYYDSGYLKLKFVGYGYYWSSSAIPQNSGYAYLLSFNSNAVIVNRAIRENGMIVQPFE